MIINLRGTSGSGKSTVIRDLLDEGVDMVRFKVPKRKQPLGYCFRHPHLHGRIAVPGHYESACGGCDTLPGYDDIFARVREGQSWYDHVVFEGLLVSEEAKRTIHLHEDGLDVRVILLSTPVEECLASIRARREARGDTRPLKEDNTRNRVATIQRTCDKLKQAGVLVVERDRDGAAAQVREWLA